MVYMNLNNDRYNDILLYRNFQVYHVIIITKPLSELAPFVVETAYKESALIFN